jgi:hypothetical protein
MDPDVVIAAMMAEVAAFVSEMLLQFYALHS